MSDEKKGAVLTGEELDRWQREVEAAPKYRGDPTTYASVPAGLVLRLLESARLARLAAELFEEHGEAILAAVSHQGRELRFLLGRFPEADKVDATQEALESTIAAFRKGAE